MATEERRKIMGLDDVYQYCRELEADKGRPVLFKLTQAIRTLDYAIAVSQGESADGPRVSEFAWSTLRDQLYTRLITCFEGSYLVFGEGGEAPLDAGSEWPEAGRVEFYPARLGRRNDMFAADLSRLDPTVLMCLRWSFADCRLHLTPASFVTDFDAFEGKDNEREQATKLLQALYQVCEKEASQGKKNAHRKWWQLYWQANSSQNKTEKHQLQKQMLHLQSMWGRPVTP